MKMPENYGYRFDAEFSTGTGLLAGVDEAGRGPLAGNVVTACVVLNPADPIKGLGDSKKLTERKRETLYQEIIERCLFFGIGRCNPAEIDRHNILGATFIAMARAIKASKCKPSLVLIDGNKPIPGLPFPQKTVIQGDDKSACIGAASILAKVTRDREMAEADKIYPDYGFKKHKGYPTKEHINAILKYGLSPIHRRSFKPKSIVQVGLFDNSSF